MSMDTLGATLASINAALDIGRAMINAPGALERAELRLRLSEMISALSEAKIDLAGAKEDAQAQIEEIRALQEALRIKATVVKHQDAYYETGPDGAPKGDPFCIKCWEGHAHRLTHLVKGEHTDRFHHCPLCSAKYNRGRSVMELGTAREETS